MESMQGNIETKPGWNDMEEKTTKTNICTHCQRGCQCKV